MSVASPLIALALALAASGCTTMGPPRVIYIARHGQTEWNRVGRYQGDPDLDSVGYLNRVSLWMLLRDRPLDSIYTSQALRTQRTAELLARQLHLPVLPRAALDEINAGALAGICAAALDPEHSRPSDQSCLVPARGSRPELTLQALQQELHQARQHRLEDRLPLGENYADLVARVVPFVDELQRGARDREVLVVGHGVVNRVLLHLLMGWPLEAVAHLRQENDQVFRLQTAAGGAGSRLELYTPGVGWRPCGTAPRPGQRELDCNPGPPAAAPTSQPTGS